MKHFIISRVALKWKFKQVGMTWEAWLKESVELYDKYLRASLRKQAFQNFTLVTLVDESVTDEQLGHRLKNEIVVRVFRMNIIHALRSQIDLSGMDKILITRCDRDDVLRNNFVHQLQMLLAADKQPPFYFDIMSYYIWNGRQLNKFQYMSDRTSPFVSTLEKVKEGKAVFYPYKYKHGYVIDQMGGVKDDSLRAIQVIHKHNVLNRMEGRQVNVTPERLKYFLNQYAIKIC